MTSREKILLGVLGFFGVAYLLSRTEKGMNLTSTLADKIAALITREEGERLTAYKDTGGAWTIGKGHLIQPGEGLFPYGEKRAITPAESNALFEKDTATARNAVTSFVTVPLNENQFAALTSLVFNIGASAFQASTLRRKLNAGDVQGAADQFDVWVYDNGVKVPGLVTRRAREKKIFLA